MNNLTTETTISSIRLSAILGYELKHTHLKIRDMFQTEIDGQIILPSLDSRGYVVEYHLHKLEASMFVAKYDSSCVSHVAEFFVEPPAMIVRVNEDETFVSSIDLAEMLGIQHKAVVQLIRNHQSFEDVNKLALEMGVSTRGPEKTIYHLSEMQTILYFGLAKTTKTTKPVKVAIVKQFQDMKNQLEGPKALPTALELAHQVVGLYEEIEVKDAALVAKELVVDTLKQIGSEMASKIEEDAPKVSFVEEYVDSEGFLSLSEAAKSLGAGQRKLMAALRSKRILMASNTAYQRYMNSGYFVAKTNTWEDRYGVPHVTSTTLVTPKGMTWLAKNLSKILV